MNRAVDHYFAKPVVFEKSTTSFDNIAMPDVYMCQNDQFSYQVWFIFNNNAKDIQALVEGVKQGVTCIHSNS